MDGTFGFLDYWRILWHKCKPLRRESVLSVINGHGEVPSKMNCDYFIKMEFMYFIYRMWIYCVAVFKICFCLTEIKL